MGRFINADAQLNPQVGLLGFNMFAYCGNNPVMGYDPTGHVDWGKFLSGVSLLSVGITACIVAATVVTAGACAPLLVAAGATFVAGGMTIANGVAEVIESTTNYNYMRDGVYKGDAQYYEKQKAFFETAAEVGTAAISMGSGSGQLCFVAGTMILVSEGVQAIESIEPGDTVWAWDEETGEVALKTVVETYVNETDELVHVFVNGEKIITTPSHPFYSPVKGWTNAIHLRAGDILVLVNGEYVIVEKVQHEILETPITVYNFQVEDYHTYFVSHTGVLVHNACRNYRNSAKKYYDTDAIGQDAHHIFPQKFRTYFENVGINIDAPWNISFIDASIHRRSSYAYNALWSDFIRNNPNATFNSVKIAGQMIMEMIF